MKVINAGARRCDGARVRGLVRHRVRVSLSARSYPEAHQPTLAPSLHRPLAPYSCRLLESGLDAGDDVMGAHREAAEVADRLELFHVDAGLERQQAAQLRVAVLLDDEVDVVGVEKLRDLVAEREAP